MPDIYEILYLWHFLMVLEVFKLPFRSGVSSFIHSANFNSTQHKLQSTRPLLIAIMDLQLDLFGVCGVWGRLHV